MLHIHRADRSDGLATGLAQVLSEPLADPFTPEVVAVPTAGIERWLTQRLSHTLGAGEGRGDGVCANVEFPFPRALIDTATGATGDREADPWDSDPWDSDPWDPDRAVWPLLEVVDARLHEEWLETLAAHLGHSDGARDDHGRADRRYPTVRHIADLFDRYAVHRPGMIRAWADGDDVNAYGEELKGGWRWQPRLWRLLREQIGVASSAERLEEACERLRSDPAVTDLPQRVSLFGLTRLPRSFLDVLRALAEHREVHLFVLHPSQGLWDRVECQQATGNDIRRADDESIEVVRHPILKAWGHDARELQVILPGASEYSDHHHPVADPPQKLLGRIQRDIRADREPSADDRLRLDPGDNSLQVHACHGMDRQVEVLRDTILHLLADDPELELRDIIVMCPDIEAYAPLIHAVFGTTETPTDQPAFHDDGAVEDRLPVLRVRLADRALRQTNPLLQMVSELLDLSAGRVTASQVLAFASLNPVRRRFGLDDDAMDRFETWIAESGIRWGIDQEHRDAYDMGDVTQGTWRAGLDRLLAGVATEAPEALSSTGVLPHDDVGSSDIALVGAMAELVDRLRQAITDLQRTQPVAAWVRCITWAVDALGALPAAQGWQRAQLERVLQQVVGQAGNHAGGAENTADGCTPTTQGVLAPAEMRDLLGPHLRGRPTRTNFRTGHLTICTLMPMRSVPHKVVCLLGLDDMAFPRTHHTDGDDLIAQRPHVGDYNRRNEDRQLLLDALMAAEQNLVITYTGRDERTNARRAPAVPVGELLDVVDATARLEPAPPGSSAADRVRVHHPLQPFDPRNFAGDAPGERPWSFDPLALAGARALTSEREPTPGFLETPLEPLPLDIIELDELTAFVRNPVRAFLKQRLNIPHPRDAVATEDVLPVTVDGLKHWEVGGALLAAYLRGTPADEAAAAQRARGHLPPGRLAEPDLERAHHNAEQIATVARERLNPNQGPTTELVDAELEDGIRITGTVTDCYGDRMSTVSYSRLAPQHRLVTWVRFLALLATYPERAISADVIGRGARDPQVGHRLFSTPEDDPERRLRWATARLKILIDLYRRGMSEPLPMAHKTSAAYAEALDRYPQGDPDLLRTAAEAWKGTYERPGEANDYEQKLVHHGRIPFEELIADAPRPDEQGPEWPDDSTRFGRYARRLWRPMLFHEEVLDQ